MYLTLRCAKQLCSKPHQTAAMNHGLPIPNMSAAVSAAIRSLAGGEQGSQLLAILQQVTDLLLWVSLSLAQHKSPAASLC